VVSEPATLRSLSVLGPYAGFLASAPVAIIPVMDAGGGVLRAFDCGRVSQSMTLAAQAVGLGSCVAAIAPDESQRVAASMLGIPEGHTVWVAIGLGYALAVAHRPADRKSLHELVHVERFGRREGELSQPVRDPIGTATHRERGE
jgi:nitroreductase